MCKYIAVGNNLIDDSKVAVDQRAWIGFIHLFILEDREN